jgi:starch phosphorylase
MTDFIFTYEPRGFKGFNDLMELALDLRWSWNHDADELWQKMALKVAK